MSTTLSHVIIMKLVISVLFSLLFSIFTLCSAASTSTKVAQHPDVTNKTVVHSLAELAANAYHKHSNSTAWRNETLLWRYIDSYGWDIDGLRGHVFEHVEDKIITISVKGTSLNSGKDKESANLICSCNCCYSNCTTTACDKDKLLQSLPNMYLTLLLIAYEDIVQVYPEHSVWFTGHSMGAVIAALGGVRTCNPAIGFSSPGEQMFADRIELKHQCPDKKTLSPVYHIGYYRDPIFVGNCGWLCSIAGYRMDSKCHHGRECVYKDSTDEDDDDGEEDGEEDDDSIGEETFGSGLIYTHTANFLIDKVIKPADKVPVCSPAVNCTERCKEDDNDENDDGDDNEVQEVEQETVLLTLQM